MVRDEKIRIEVPFRATLRLKLWRFLSTVAVDSPATKQPEVHPDLRHAGFAAAANRESSSDVPNDSKLSQKVRLQRENGALGFPCAGRARTREGLAVAPARADDGLALWCKDTPAQQGPVRGITRDWRMAGSRSRSPAGDSPKSSADHRQRPFSRALLES